MEADTLIRELRAWGVDRAGLVALLGFAVAALVGCAAPGSWVPYCEGDSLVAPSRQCAALPESAETIERLGALIDGRGPLAVRVSFGPSSKVESVCAIRSDVPRQRDTILELNARLEQIRQTPPGPACLAGVTLVLNQSGAALGALREVLRDCGNAPASGRGFDLSDRACLVSQQVRRGELWFFNTRRDLPYVFVPGEPAKGRAEALDRCSDDDRRLVRTGPGEIKLGNTRSLQRLTECMQGLGWNRTV